VIALGETLYTLENLTEMIREFVKERNWQQYNRPLNLAISVSIEANELLELFQWKTNEDVQEALKDAQFREALASEIADVFIYLLRVADTTDIDIMKAAIEKLKKNREKYPIDYWNGRSPSRFNRTK
jgi:dCTP diphosphatase